MRLKQKREIVRRFMVGKTIGDLAQVYFKLNHRLNWIEVIEDCLRDFLNGKFTLEPEVLPRPEKDPLKKLYASPAFEKKWEGTLKQIAAEINVYLKKFEADPAINVWDDGRVNGTRPYYRAFAFQAGRYAGVKYISYQSTSYLTKAEAAKYLEWLKAGNVGRHDQALSEER